MKILLIGGTGTISAACTRLAAERGIEVYLLNRGQRRMDVPAQVRSLVADINKPADVQAALGSLAFDAVANFIAFVPEHIERDLQLFSGRTAQYIFISSASAYQKPPSNYLITESTPLANPYWEYSRNKIACEERLLRAYRETGFPAVIVRPSLTYNESMIPLSFHSWGKPYTVADRMKKGLPVIVPGDGTSLWQTTHNSDFAKGFVGLLGLPASIGHAFHISTDEVLSQNQHYEALAILLNVRPNLVHVASQTLAKFEPALEGSLLGDKAHSVVLDNTKIKRFVPEYIATTPFIRGLEKSLAWFHGDPARQAVDDAFNALTDRILAGER